MKSRLIITLVLIGVMALSIGLGTYAWFTANATTTPVTFQTGNFKITADQTGTTTTALAPNAAPGDEVGTVAFSVTNSGNYNMILFSKLSYSGSEDLAKAIILKGYKVDDWSGNIDWTSGNEFHPWMTGLDLNTDKKISLYELATYGDCAGAPGWVLMGLKPTEFKNIKYVFELDKAATTAICGKSVSVTATVTGAQPRADAIKDTMSGTGLDTDYNSNYIVEWASKHF